MPNCNCGNHGSGPQSRPLEDWEYPDTNERTYDRDDDPDIYDDPNYGGVYSDSAEGIGGVTYAGANYGTSNEDASGRSQGCSCGHNCACGQGRAHDEYDDQDDDYDEDDDLIVRCPKCGAELYDDDTECPKCGHYITEEDNQNVPIWIILTGAVLLIAILFGMTYYR